MNNIRQQVENSFLEWQISLPSSFQDQVIFHNYDMKLETLFVQRLDGLDTFRIAELESHIKKIHPSLLVSSVRIG